MNKNLIIGLIIGLVVIIGGGAAFVLSGDDEMSSSNTSVSFVDMSAIPENLEEEVKKAISRQSMSNVIVLDVRTDEEWDELHAMDAFLWGLADQLENGKLPPLDKNMEIYVYCRTGRRAGIAIKILQEAGYTNLTNIRGLEDWVAAGGTTTTGADGDDQEVTSEATQSNDDMDIMTVPSSMMN